MRIFCRHLEIAISVVCLSTLVRPQHAPDPFTFPPQRRQFTFTSAEQPSRYSKEAVIINSYVTRVSFDENGLGTRENRAVLRVQSEAGVQSLAVLVFPYKSNEEVDILYVRVRKSDGSLAVTPPQSYQDLASSVSRLAPIYSDLHEKHVPVKSLNIGDVLEYAVRYRAVKPEIPGHFWFAHSLIKDVIVIDEVLEIHIPSRKYVKVSSADLKPLMLTKHSRE